MTPRARARSFHLRGEPPSPSLSAPPSPASPGRSVTPRLNVARRGLEISTAQIGPGLLALARQASTFLLGGCAPGVQHRRRVPRALVEGRCAIAGAVGEGVGIGIGKREEGEDVEAGSFTESEPNVEGRKTGLEVSVEEPQVDNVLFDAETDLTADDNETKTQPQTQPQIQTQTHDPTARVEAEREPERAPPKADLPLHETEAVCANPPPPRDPEPPAPTDPAHAQIRAEVVHKFAAFTAARLARASLPPTPLLLTTPPQHPHRPMLDDPFAASPAAPRAPVHFVPAHPLRLHYPSLHPLRTDQQQSPTPQPRPGRLRPPLRQQTVFFKQPSVLQPTGPKPPAYWAPHPAGKRSCAVPIKAPYDRDVEDKEN
ncbi:hypothetical protein DFH07DRAFT_783292 [Mycena maculata]|uniref:Uncharacterized protein n=1 Tax=Mycena maculata TaxID=230809 RepID=A0AAD7HNA1_9AGAR|nr:hypothetical protein DFH07DRAFT_783292 [Mycena maculata]